MPSVVVIVRESAVNAQLSLADLIMKPTICCTSHGVKNTWETWTARSRDKKQHKKLSVFSR